MSPVMLDRNENQYGPSPGCYQVLRKADLEHLSLYSRSFLSGIKSQLSARLARDIGIPEERVLLSYGSEDMLKQTVHCYLQPGQTLLLPRQSWWYYKSVAAEVLGSQVAYDLHVGDDRFDYDADEIIGLYEKHRPAVILIASPNNPTGNSIDAGALHRVTGHCQESVIVLDQAYHGFAEGRQEDVNALLNSHPSIVVLRTFSKYYALAGLRIGYACVGTGLGRLIAYSARYLGYNRLSEEIALAALDDESYYRSISRRMKEDLDTMHAIFAGVEGFTPFRSDANFLLIRFPGELKTTLQEGLRQNGVVVKFLDDPGLTDCMRITIGTREQNGLTIAAFQKVINEVRAPSPTQA